MTTIFKKIIDGELPSHKVYEDENHLAFLDIFPFDKGHTLVIPKKEYENISDMPEDEYLELQAVVLRLVKHLGERLGVKMGTMVYGVDIAHVHIHIFPITKHLEVFDFKKVKKYQEGEAEKFLEKLKI